MSMRDAGYTLIELVVVLLLLSFVSLLVAGGVQFGTRVWERSAKAVDGSDSTTLAQRTLRTLLSSATPAINDGFASFDGDTQHAAFEVPAPAAFGSGGIVQATLSLDRTADGSSIAITLASPLDKSMTRKAVLASPRAILQLAYLDASGRVPAWLAVWRNRSRLPDAVRIAALSPEAGAAWPTFLVRLPIAQDGSCVFDPVSLSCRRA